MLRDDAEEKRLVGSAKPVKFHKKVRSDLVNTAVKPIISSVKWWSVCQKNEKG